MSPARCRPIAAAFTPPPPYPRPQHFHRTHHDPFTHFLANLLPGTPYPSCAPVCVTRPKVFELQPDIAWDKGKAVLWLLDKLVVPMVSMAAEAAGAEDAPSSAAAPANGAASSVSGGAAGGGGGGDRGTNGVPGGGSAVQGTATPAPAPARAWSTSGAAWADEEDLDEPGDAGKFFTIFIGDDKTDEVCEGGGEGGGEGVRTASRSSTEHRAGVTCPSVACPKVFIYCFSPRVPCRRVNLASGLYLPPGGCFRSPG